MVFVECMQYRTVDSIQIEERQTFIRFDLVSNIVVELDYCLDASLRHWSVCKKDRHPLFFQD